MEGCEPLASGQLNYTFVTFVAKTEQMWQVIYKFFSLYFHCFQHQQIFKKKKKVSHYTTAFVEWSHVTLAYLPIWTAFLENSAKRKEKEQERNHYHFQIEFIVVQLHIVQKMAQLLQIIIVANRMHYVYTSLYVRPDQAE